MVLFLLKNGFMIQILKLNKNHQQMEELDYYIIIVLLIVNILSHIILDLIIFPFQMNGMMNLCKIMREIRNLFNKLYIVLFPINQIM